MKSTLLCLLMAGIHIWSVVLSVQVNGFSSLWGVSAATLSLTMPFFSELLWGFWAYKHDHPFFFAAVVFWVVIGALMIAHMRGGFGNDSNQR